jgi:hypothetical protein
MNEIAPGDWDTLQSLTGRLGLPAERVGVLRRRLEGTQVRPGSPYTLLAGRPDAGIELLLARWLAPEAAEELLKAGGRPLVIGPTTAEVRPRLGAWPGWKTARVKPGHLLALRAASKPAADTLAQLASLGYVEQLVLVTRLGQALHQEECALAAALAGTAATVRVLIVGLPGEEPTDADLAEVSAYAVTRMRQAGFTGGRCLGAGVWFTGGGPRPGTVADLTSFLAVNDREVAAGRAGMGREAVAGLLADLRRQAEALPPAPQAAVPDEERERLGRELNGYLSDLGRELDRLAGERRPLSAEFLRNHALDAVRGWGAYATVEGHWLKYVERLRPGTQAAFLAEAQSAIGLLEYDPGKETPPAPEPAAVPGSPVVNQVMLEAKRLAVGLVVGLAAYLAVAALLRGHAAGAAEDVTALPALAVTLLSYAALVLGAVLGYGAGRALLRARPATPPPQVKERVPAALHGWPQVQRRLTAWFGEHMRTGAPSPAEECRALARRWGLEDTQV